VHLSGNSLSYWSQAGVAMKYPKDHGAKKGTKIAYV
jgi:hypothetical protein